MQSSLCPVCFPVQENKNGATEEEEKQPENGKKEEERGREQEGEREADKTEAEMGKKKQLNEADTVNTGSVSKVIQM